MMTVELVDAGLDALGRRQRLPSPFKIETLRQSFQQVEQTLALREDESCDDRHGDRIAQRARSPIPLPGYTMRKSAKPKSVKTIWLTNSKVRSTMVLAPAMPGGTP